MPTLRRSVTDARTGSLILLAALGFATEARADSEAFGQCLARSGAIFFGASWCPVCEAQRRVLGPAMAEVRYVECSRDGERGGQRSRCEDAGVEGYPTWVFGDGARMTGRLSLERLASRSGCRLERPDAGDPARPGETDAIPVRRSRTGGGGALTIEIP